MADKQTLRINRYLSSCGLGSRRECEQFITKGLVRVNGIVADTLGMQIDPKSDKVEYNAQIIKPLEQDVYLMMNKPKGVVVSRDGQGKPTVFDLLKGFPENLSYSGRLDADSEGLLFLSTDGEMNNRLTHPKYKTTKIYLVWIPRILSEPELNRFRNGINLDGELTLPAQIELIREAPVYYRVILEEGKNRQIRRMMEALGCRVTKLVRVSFGPLRLGNLEPGHTRKISENELGKLRRNLKLSVKFESKD